MSVGRMMPQLSGHGLEEDRDRPRQHGVVQEHAASGDLPVRAGPAAGPPAAENNNSERSRRPWNNVTVGITAAPNTPCSIGYTTPLGTRSTAAGL
ncbi:MAG: hypothetical protein JO247_04620 [Chloroflexi bacterium]|nr:hypothetical protein [Chloroflexota bacterium]